MNYGRYANVETNLFPDLAKEFQRSGSLSGRDLLAILGWKANRAVNKHRIRLQRNGKTFDEVARQLGLDISRADAPQSRLELLLGQPWGFRLPTASAILTVLYPNDFTVFDWRVCDELNFPNRKPARTSNWKYYSDFKTAVLAATPLAKDLRASDHHLWGKSWVVGADIRLAMTHDELLAERDGRRLRAN